MYGIPRRGETGEEGKPMSLFARFVCLMDDSNSTDKPLPDDVVAEVSNSSHVISMLNSCCFVMVVVVIEIRKTIIQNSRGKASSFRQRYQD